MCKSVCVSIKPSWSLGISAQTNIQKLVSHVGNQQPAGQSKGNPQRTEKAEKLWMKVFFLLPIKEINSTSSLKKPNKQTKGGRVAVKKPFLMKAKQEEKAEVYLIRQELD